MELEGDGDGVGHRQRGKEMRKERGRSYHDTKPRKDWTSLTFVGVSHSITLWTFVGSMATWSFKMTSPRYSTSFCSNLHFSGLRNSLCLQRVARTWQPISQCSERVGG